MLMSVRWDHMVVKAVRSVTTSLAATAVTARQDTSLMPCVRSAQVGSTAAHTVGSAKLNRIILMFILILIFITTEHAYLITLQRRKPPFHSLNLLNPS